MVAAFDGVTSAPLGASSTVLDPLQTARAPTSLTDIVVAAPGLSENGQGGLFQNVSLRGVSRNRVMHLIAGARVITDRRAGPSTSFVDPLLMGSVEILRGPSMTFYGSGALGGVIQVFPGSTEDWTATVGYDGQGNERVVMAGVGDDGWSVMAAHRKADRANAADGTLLNTQFEQTSATLRWTRSRRGRRYELLVLPSQATDIGKANSDFPGRTTNYPQERHGLVRFAFTGAKGWRLETYVHGQDLETEVVEGVKRSRVSNDSVDYGVRWEHQVTHGEDVTIRFGVEGFGRADVNAEEIADSLDTGVIERRSKTLDGASSIEGGGYAAVRWSWGKTTYEVGGRLAAIDQQDGLGATRDRTGWSGFAGFSRPITQRLQIRGSLSSSLRFPSLSEQFFSGTTGRGQVRGNPNLEDERSRNGELSLRWVGKRVLVHGEVFYNRIQDYIERVQIGPDLITFVNVPSGTIRGFELQAFFKLSSRWTLDAGGHVIEGRDDNDSPLADVPPSEIFTGASFQSGPWGLEARLAHRDRKTDPASGEKEIGSANLLDATLQYRIGDSWSLALTATNLLDELYFRSADEQAPLAAGRSMGLRASWRR